MTAPDETTDPVPLFRTALTPAARSHLVLNDDTRRHIRAACRRLTPAELARIVGRDVGWQRPYNAASVIAWRLAREAGEPPDNERDET